jgi:2-polyprenyl-3-methyl-5-hydroxy-6-metoxy-1,4-benzoquinol methylase
MTQDHSVKLVADQKEWSAVAQELETENLKLASYDNTLMSVIGDVTKKKILDYGAGPGVLAVGLQRMGADVKVWDINSEIREKAGAKIGAENIYNDIRQVPKNCFDIIICNLVLCIVPEIEVRNIVENIKDSLTAGGSAYIGFCNPKIFQVAESNLDFRFPTGNTYEDNHDYKKIKKEGGYEIIETHRPLDWYEKIYAKASLKLTGTFFTPEYELNGNKISDFVISRLEK